MLKLRFLTPILVTSVLVACSSDNSGGPDGGEGGETSETGGSGNDNLGGNGNLSVEAQKTVDEDGGTVETETAELSIPAGALPAGTEIKIASLNRAAIEELPQTSSDIVLAAEPVAFLPHGLTFDEPVAVALSFDEGAVGDVPLVVMKLDNEEDTTWEVVPGATFKNGQAHFEITSFSVYGVFEDPKGKAEELYSGEDTGGSGGSTGTGGDEGSGGDESTGGKENSGGKGGDEGAGGTPQGGTAGGPGAGGKGGQGGQGGTAGGPSGGGGQGGTAGGPSGGGGQGGTAGGPSGGGGQGGSAGGPSGGGGTSQGGTAGGPSGGGGTTGGPGDGGASQGGGIGMGGAGEGGGGVGGVGGVGGGPGGDENPGYLSGPWHGYGWVWSTESSQIESDIGERNGPNCAWGTTGAGFGELALLGYNINESLEGGDSVKTLVSGEGVFVDIQDFWGREHRIQLSVDGGAKTWCALYSGQDFIPWEDFSTECWSPETGEVFNPAADEIETAGVVVPGRVEEEPFDFCLDKLEPGMAPQFGYFVHDGFRGDGYVETSGSTDVFEDTMATSYELPVRASGDFGPVQDSDVTLWFNLNQAEPGGDEGTFVPELDGVQVEVDSHGGEWMRVVISDGTTTWCAPHYGGFDELVPWTEFETGCGTGSGTPYELEPITALGVRFWASPEALANESTDFEVGVWRFFERAFDGEGYLEQGEHLAPAGEECFEDGEGGLECFPIGGSGPGWRGYGALNLAGGATGSSNLFHTRGPNYCAMGTLPAGLDASAELLFRLNQEHDGSLVAPLTYTNDGALIDLQNQNGTAVNAILVAEDGTRYCYPTTAEDDFVPWEEFNTECDGSGVMLMPDVLLTHGGVVMPASVESETNYNVCFRGIMARSEPVYGYLGGFPYRGQGSTAVGGTTELSYDNLSTSEGTPYCMGGLLGDSPEDFARLRFGANQEMGGTEALAFPEGDGLRVSYDYMFEEKTRVVLTTPTQEFCADLHDFGVGVSWQDFALCDGSGTPYSGEPFLAISLEVVPGGSASFDTCLYDLSPYEEGGPGGGMGGAGPGGGMGGAPNGGGGSGGGGEPSERTDFHPGYIDDGTWFGQGWTFASAQSLIESDVNDWDGPLACAWGEVGAPFSEFASLGYDIADGVSTPVSGDGVLVQLKDMAGREHRVNLYDVESGKSYCASIGSAPGTIFVPWTAFNDACWDGSGVAFDPATHQVTNIAIQVPSSGMVEPFDFCIERLETAFMAAP